MEWILNHPHVISSPIPRDTVLVKVPQPNGEIVSERVGKLLLEISVRELHQDLMKPPPIGLSEVYCQSTNQCIISERHLRNILPPQLRPITFSQKQLCGYECCTVMKMVHTSLIKYRRKVIRSSVPQSNGSTRRQNNVSHSIEEHITFLKENSIVLSTDLHDIIKTMSCTVSEDNGLMKWNCAMGRCIFYPNLQLPHPYGIDGELSVK